MIVAQLKNLATKPSLAILISFFVAAFQTFQRPLVAEDATVLFHRVNYTDLSIPFFYAGYASVPAQLVSYMAGDLPFVVQIITYSVVAFGIWSLMIWKISTFFGMGRSYAPVVVVLYFSIFDPIYFYNLSYSLWPSLLVCILITARYLDEMKINGLDLLLLIFLATASPLSIVCVLLILIFGISQKAIETRQRESRHRYKITVVDFLGLLALCAALSLIIFLIVDPNGSRSQPESILSNLKDVIFQIFLNPLAPFRVQDPSGGISIIGYFHFFCFLACAAVALSYPWMPPCAVKSTRILAVLIGALLALFISILTGGVQSFPLAVRYIFPIIVAAILIIMLLSGSENIRALFGIFTWVGILIICGRVFVDLGSTWPDQKVVWGKIISFSLQGAQVDSEFYLQRSDGWNVAFGSFFFDQGQCAEPINQDSDVLFAIHCSSEDSIRVRAD